MSTALQVRVVERHIAGTETEREVLMTTRTRRAIVASVADSVFALFPEYRRGVIWAHTVINNTSPSALTALVEEDTYGLVSGQCLREHPRMAYWRDVYAALGEDTRRGASSFEKVLECVAGNGQLSLSTPVQDIALILSLWHLVPVTVFALDELQESVALRVAIGQESFLPQGASHIERPRAGEIIGIDAETVLTRHWNGCQTRYAQITHETTAVIFCVDAMPIIAGAELEGICEETVSLLDTYCESTARYALLSQNTPRVTLW